MTGPEDPGGDAEDWGFPEVDPASPSSTALPEPEVTDEQVVYDTGSDAWWRAQAEAQRAAAASEPISPTTPPPPAAPAPPPELVEPEVLLPSVTDPTTAPAPMPSPPSPLDREWLPPHLPELRRPVDPEPEAPVHDEPVHDEPAYEEPVYDGPVAQDGEEPGPAPHEPTTDWYRSLVDGATPEVVAAPMPEQVPAPEVGQEEPRLRPAYAEDTKISRPRAVAGALLALAGVALGIGALFYLNAKNPDAGGSTVASPPSASSTPSTAPSSQPTRASTAPAVVTTAPAATAATPSPTRPAAAPVVPVSVLNNSRTHGLAATAAARFRAGGWPVPQTGNYRGLIEATTVYFGPGQQASAERFAHQFGIARVLPRSDLPGIPVQGMTVVLTRDYRA